MTDIPVTAPFDGSEITTVPNATREDVERALATAHGLYRDRDGWLSKPQRIEILRKAVEIIKERREELAVAAARDEGQQRDRQVCCERKGAGQRAEQAAAERRQRKDFEL